MSSFSLTLYGVYTLDDFKAFGELDNQGTVLFIHAAEHDLYIVYEDIEDGAYFVFITDKYLNIKSTVEIMLPEEVEYSDLEDFHWFSPSVLENREITFSGLVMVKDTPHRFVIDEDRNMRLKEESRKVYNGTKITNIDHKCLEGITVDHCVRRMSHLYVVGYDEVSSCQVYCQVDTEKDICLKLYHLGCSSGEVLVNAISVDIREQGVYIGGEVSHHDEDGNYTYSTPYVESFLIG